MYSTIFSFICLDILNMQVQTKYSHMIVNLMTMVT